VRSRVAGLGSETGAMTAGVRADLAGFASKMRSVKGDAIAAIEALSKSCDMLRHANRANEKRVLKLTAALRRREAEHRECDSESRRLRQVETEARDRADETGKKLAELQGRYEMALASIELMRRKNSSAEKRMAQLEESVVRKGTAETELTGKLQAQARESAQFRDEIVAVLRQSASSHAAGVREESEVRGGAVESETIERLRTHVQSCKDDAVRLASENAKLKDEVTEAVRLRMAAETERAAVERELSQRLEAQERESAQFREDVEATLRQSAGPQAIDEELVGPAGRATVTRLSAHMQRHAEDAAGLARENAKFKDEVAMAVRPRKSSETKRAAAVRELTE